MNLQRGSSNANAQPDFFSHDVAKARRFYLDFAPPKGVKLAVVCGGLEHSTPAYVISRATFVHYAIEYVVRGLGDLRLIGRNYALQPGLIFSYGPGIPQRITCSAGEPLVKYFVDFVGTDALALLRSCGLSPGKVSEVFPPHALESIFDEIIDDGRRLARESVNLCSKLLECLALKIVSAQAPMGGTETLAFAAYEQSRQYIAEHFLELRSLGEVSAKCHVSSPYLCSLFRRYGDQSPYQYLLRLKMNAAAERLAQPGALVKSVADEMGFTDPFHFSRTFRRVLGISPVKFRRMR